MHEEIKQLQSRFNIAELTLCISEHGYTESLATLFGDELSELNIELDTPQDEILNTLNSKLEISEEFIVELVLGYITILGILILLAKITAKLDTSIFLWNKYLNTILNDNAWDKFPKKEFDNISSTVTAQTWSYSEAKHNLYVATEILNGIININPTDFRMSQVDEWIGMLELKLSKKDLMRPSAPGNDFINRTLKQHGWSDKTVHEFRSILTTSIINYTTINIKLQELYKFTAKNKIKSDTVTSKKDAKIQAAKLVAVARGACYNINNAILCFEQVLNQSEYYKNNFDSYVNYYEWN